MKNFQYIMICILFFTGAISTYTQIPAPKQSNIVAVTGGTVVTVSGEEIQGGTVLFENGIITSVGENVVIPVDAEIVDATGKYIYPAMIHARSSLGLSEIGRISETVDLNEHGTINPNVRAQVAFHAASEHIPVAKVHGIAVAVATPSGGIVSGLSAAMLTDGWDWEEMTFMAPAALIINWPDMSNERTRESALKQLDEAFEAARRYRRARQAEGTGSISHRHDVRWEAMIPVLDGDVPVHINANDIAQIQAAVNWAEKEQVRMVLVGGRDAGYLLQQLRDKDIPVIVTPVIGGPARQWEAYDVSYRLPSVLHEAGIRYCIAGDYNAAYVARLANHPASAVAFGLPLEEAVRSVTLYPAMILGIDDKMGSIEAGKDASIIITDGNLLELSTRIEQMFIRGRRVDMTDRHRRLYELYRERYR